MPGGGALLPAERPRAAGERGGRAVAGLAICAWLDLLLSLGRLPPVASWRAAVPFLLLCALVWEVLAPLWKPEAVGDPWDLLAYQAGGLVWLAVRRVKI